MDWFTGIVVYLLIWWLALFVVLPIGTRPTEQADPEAGGWRGVPARPQLLRKAIGTTLLAGVLWLGVFALIESDLVSFRDGFFAYQGPGSSVMPSRPAQN